jgi:hypothetical protein
MSDRHQKKGADFASKYRNKKTDQHFERNIFRSQSKQTIAIASRNRAPLRNNVEKILKMSNSSAPS